MGAQALLVGSIVAMLGVTGFLLLRQPLGLRSLRYQLLLRVAAPCNYGQQPYRFSPEPAPIAGSSKPQWSFQARDQRCRLQPLVSALLAGSRQEGGWQGRQLRILFNGDRCRCESRQ